MLVGIVSLFSNTWFLLCLEILHSDWFYGMWYLLCLEILHSHWASTFLLQKGAAFLLSLHPDWLSGLEKEGASIIQKASNSFVILEINL